MRPFEAFAKWKEECTVYQMLPMEMRVKFGDFILSVFCSTYQYGYVAGRADGEVVGKLKAEAEADKPARKPRTRKQKLSTDPFAVGVE